MKNARVGPSIKQTLSYTLAALWGCTPALSVTPTTPVTPVASPKAHDGATEGQAPAHQATCRGAGPLASDEAPASDQAGLCEQLRKALEGHPHRDDLPRDEQETVTRVERCTDLVAMPSAPSGSLVPGVMIVSVIGELGDVPAEGSYLVVQRAGGLCLADRVLPMEWYHGGHFETDFDVRYVDATHLTVRAHRLKRVPLEAQQTAEEGADIDWEACDHVAYELGDGGLRRDEARSDEGPCSAK